MFARRVREHSVCYRKHLVSLKFEQADDVLNDFEGIGVCVYVALCEKISPHRFTENISLTFLRE